MSRTHYQGHSMHIPKNQPLPKKFTNRFKPVKNHLNSEAVFDGCLFEHKGVEFDYIKNQNPAHIWTVSIDQSQGNIALTQGINQANATGFLICVDQTESANDEKWC